MSDTSDFTTKDMSDMLYDDLSEIEDIAGTQTEVVLIQPSTDSIFPCRVLSTPLENVNLTDYNTGEALRKTFQITIEHWASEQRFCMEMASNTDKALQKRNIIKTGANPIIYDDITKKYRFISNYEVRWYRLTNSFTLIK